MTFNLDNAIENETYNVEITKSNNKTNPKRKTKRSKIKILIPNVNSMTFENYIAETIKTHCLKQWF